MSENMEVPQEQAKKCPFSPKIGHRDVPHSAECKEADGQGEVVDRCIPHLLQKHKNDIDKLRGKCSDLITDEIHDDVWLLRYILSKGKVKDCVSSIERAMVWRNANKEAILLAKDPRAQHPTYPKIREFVAVDMHQKQKRDGGPFFIIRSGISNPQKLMQNVSYDDMYAFLMFQREQAYQMCDSHTRQSGRLTKMTSVNDFTGLSLLRGREKKFMKALSESAKMSEDCYPQLIDYMVMINVNKVVLVLYSLFKMLMPKSTLKKVSMCGATNTREEDIDRCPWVKTHVDVADVPTFLGGDCVCPAGCVEGVDNNRTEHMGDD